MCDLPAVSDSRLGTFNRADAHVAVHVTPLLRAPDRNAPIDSELLYGESVTIEAEAGDFLHVVNSTDLYRGFVARSDLAYSAAEADYMPSYRIKVPVTQLYRDPSVKARAILRLFMGSLVCSPSRTPNDTDDFIEVEGGFMVKQHVSPIGIKNEDPLQSAESWIGLPYLWGGRTANGVDCSALVQLLFGEAGIPLHRDSDLQWQTSGQLVPDGTSPKRGDLAFFPGHVGIMIDGTHILHANATHMAVTIDPLEDVKSWVRADLETRGIPKGPFLGFKRIQGLAP